MTQDAPIALEGRRVTEADVPVAVRKFFEALNAEDFVRLAGLWTEAAELIAVGSRPRRGVDDVLAYYYPLFGPWAEHTDQPTRWIVAGDTVVVEVHFTGVTQEGRQLEFDAVDVFDLEDGAIARLSTWYDLAWVRKQL
jgi:ketosteroid isomerase-like protein